jgi:hypothetical protein
MPSAGPGGRSATANATTPGAGSGTRSHAVWRSTDGNSCSGGRSVWWAL